MELNRHKVDTAASVTFAAAYWAAWASVRSWGPLSGAPIVLLAAIAAVPCASPGLVRWVSAGAEVRAHRRMTWDDHLAVLVDRLLTRVAERGQR